MSIFCQDFRETSSNTAAVIASFRRKSWLLFSSCSCPPAKLLVPRCEKRRCYSKLKAKLPAGSLGLITRSWLSSVMPAESMPVGCARLGPGGLWLMKQRPPGPPSRLASLGSLS